MRIGLTGATGLVGAFLQQGLRAAGHDLITLGRQGADVAFDLEAAPPSLCGLDVLIHAGFAHVPGRYRGGEGTDPKGFVRRNQHGSLRLFERAAGDGVQLGIFLSSRAVYGDYPPGTDLTEDLPPRPDTLYGQVKWAVEQALPDVMPRSVALRATGVYGPGANHKWRPLFEAFARREAISPRCATELHGRDLAQAVQLCLPLMGHHRFNVSDLLLDRHDLLAAVARLTDPGLPLPARADSRPNVMTCTGLRAMGWRPGGWPLLHQSLPDMLV